MDTKTCWPSSSTNTLWIRSPAPFSFWGMLKAVCFFLLNFLFLYFSEGEGRGKGSFNVQYSLPLVLRTTSFSLEVANIRTSRAVAMDTRSPLSNVGIHSNCCNSNSPMPSSEKSSANVGSSFVSKSGRGASSSW